MDNSTTPIPPDPVLARLESRLLKLEEKRTEEVPPRLREWLGFAALIIGIVLSGISLFDTFFIKPREGHLKTLDDFNKSVNAVASLRQKIIEIQSQTNKPEVLVNINSAITPQILANIQYATALLPDLGDRAGIPQLIVLISEAINIYDWKSAETLVNKATSIPDPLPTLKSEAYRYKARLMFMTGRIQDGRLAFESSLTSIRGEPGWGIDGARAYIAADWALFEYSLGDCALASERILNFKNYIQGVQVAAPMRDGLTANLAMQLAQIGNRRCPNIPALANTQ